MGQREEDVSVRLVGENGISMSGLDCGKAKSRVGNFVRFSNKWMKLESNLLTLIVRPLILAFKAARVCLALCT